MTEDIPESEKVDENSENKGLTPVQERFIVAMQSMPTIKAAASSVGITARTVLNWMKLPHFKQAYEEAHRRVYDESLEGLRDGVNDAILVLKTVMADEKADSAVRVRAANMYLQHSLRVNKLDEHETLLQELEAIKASWHVRQ
jgi:hypothetical protein